MQFIGIDLHTNRFTCCYREDSTSADGKDGKQTETFELTSDGLSAFYKTLTAQTYALIEATNSIFAFVRAYTAIGKKVTVANTYELKQISLVRKKTDKVDVDKLCRIIKMQTISSVSVPPLEIQELRGLFCTYRLYRKQTTQYKNRIHSLLKEKLYGFTEEEIFDKKRREMMRGITFMLYPNMKTA